MINYKEYTGNQKIRTISKKLKCLVQQNKSISETILNFLIWLIVLLVILPGYVLYLFIDIIFFQSKRQQKEAQAEKEKLSNLCRMYYETGYRDCSMNYPNQNNDPDWPGNCIKD